jgi:copper chaperone
MKTPMETPMETVNFKVHGMSCNGCVASVTRVLQAVPGVERATVDLERGSAEVVFDPARTGIVALKLAVEDAGYEPL